MITLNNINLSSIDLSGIDLRGIKLGLGGRGGGSGDGFPVLPGDVTRWHFGGLTNEMMAAMDDPRIEDADHKGRFLSFKNFAWSGMSGVGGYTENYDSISWLKVKSRIDVTWTYKSFNARSIKDNTAAQLFYQSSASGTGFRVLSCTIKVSGLTDGQGIEYVSNGAQQFVIMRIENDGIYHLPSFDFGAKNAYYGFKFLKLQESCNITIEQLPIYPGALVFDGVDDYGVCDNFPILTKEKGYTVVALRQWISMGEGISGLVSNVKNWFNDGAFVLEYNSNNATNKFVNRPVSFGKVNIEMDLPNNFTYQTSKSYKGVPITTGSFKGTNSLFVGKLDNIIGNYSNVAIWELVFLDHDATEEELTKIKDYFVKTYPWLFPDQAWTVTGKTNEDEDRATIANITGNGNDLVLSNFGFIEGSGYNEEGEYAGYLVTDGVDDKITSSAFKMGKDFTVVGEWKFLKEDVIKLAGFVKFDAFMFYNYSYRNRINIYIYNPQGVAFKADTIKAVTSEGQVYFDFNSIKEVKPGDLADRGYVMNIGHNGSDHTKLALKNFAIYPTVLSKDDCIKAYNYLQTLKTK